MNQDFSRRISIIIDKSLPAWQSLNGLAHISAHFGHFLTDNYATGQFFTTRDLINIPRNTQYPIIVFEANSDSLLDFAKKIKDNPEVEKMYFVSEMIETTNDNDIQNSLSNKNFDQVNFLGIGIFGRNSTVKDLTKRFKLWS